MVISEGIWSARSLRVAPQASVERVSSSSRELLATKASGLDLGEVSTVVIPTSNTSSSMLLPKLCYGTRKIVAALRSFLRRFLSSDMTCAPGLSLLDKPSPVGNTVTGTLFGCKKGHVRFAVQEDPRAQPVLLLELAIPTNFLVKDMASGLVRIALECERTQNRGQLYLQPVWSMYCNGRKTGYAIRKTCTEMDLHILTVVMCVSMGAGLIPKEEGSSDGEVMFMRARFERVVGSEDSEAFYMMNPDGTGGPELSIFLLRV